MIYRYRSIDKVLEFKELEKQELYFSKLDDLNDYAEGFINLKWFGDEICWKGLFKHYIYCLDLTLLKLSLKAEIDDIKEIPIYLDLTRVTDKHKEILSKITDIFFNLESVKFLLKKLENDKIKLSSYEIEFFLKFYHTIIIDILICVNNDMPEEKIIKDFGIDSFVVFLDEYFKNETFKNEKETYLNIILNSLLKIEEKNNFKDEKTGFVYKLFTSEYISKLKYLTYPEWYISCFSESFDNPVMWSSYADSNKGICLIFKYETIKNDKIIELHDKIGIRNGEDYYGYSKFRFEKVNYSGEFKEINFFNSLGRLNRNQLDIWLSDKEQISEYYKHDDEWRNQYWDNFNDLVSTKNPQWSYENEYRLISDNLFFSKDSLKDRVLKYKFTNLDGIIFGLNTTEENKSSIINIIAKKCKENNRDKFNFYKIKTSVDTGKMKKEICTSSIQKFNYILNNKEIE